jgi:DNA invertase Pin-like site-specific DNA recombinase
MDTMDAVIYVRVSSDEQIKGTSLASQEADCRAYCARQGLTVTKVFIDAGESAKTQDRPKFLELIAWCQRYKPAFVCVWKYDRWARNSQDHAVYEAALAKGQTKLVSATEPASDNPAGRLMVTMLSAIAQFDNEVKAERSKRSMHEVAMRGGWVTVPPFGFKAERSGRLPILVHDPLKADIVRDLFDGLATGRRNLAQTVSVGIEQGLRDQSVRDMLRKPVYAGHYRGPLTRGHEVTLAFPGIVPRSTWNTVQDVLDGKSVGRSGFSLQRDEFPLRGLVLCDICGQPVTAAWARGRSQRYPYYACQHGHVRIRAELVHESWLDLMRADASEYIPVLDQMRRRAPDIVRERLDAADIVYGRSTSTVEQLQARRRRLLDLYTDGGIDMATFQARDAELGAQVGAIKTHAADVLKWDFDVYDIVGKTIRLFEDPVALWARLDLPARRRFCLALYSGKIRMTSSGLIKPRENTGLTGVLSDLTTGKTDVVRLAGILANLKRSLDPIIDLAA